MELIDFWNYYNSIALFQIPYMTLAWVLCVLLKNGSYVDFAWPSGFMIMTIQIFLNAKGYFYRKVLLAIPYLICGLRFIFGWTFSRKHYKHEDRRWNLWRDLWSKGEGLFQIKNLNLNFFIFYHCQSFTNIFIFSAPLILAFNNTNPHISYTEIFGLMLWFISFIFENLADLQLAKFKKNKLNRNKVMKYGLWKYSRHPNYFFEWLIWNSYSIIAISSVEKLFELVLLLLVSVIVYYFLVYFTGIPICEKAALEKRGEEYLNYQNTTSQFFLWLPSNEL